MDPNKGRPEAYPALGRANSASALQSLLVDAELVAMLQGDTNTLKMPTVGLDSSLVGFRRVVSSPHDTRLAGTPEPQRPLSSLGFDVRSSVSSQRERTISSSSVDEHFARALSSKSSVKGPHRSAPYDKNTRMVRTGSLPELWNSQMQSLDTAVSQLIAADSESSDLSEKPLRQRNLPSSFFSPSTERDMRSPDTSGATLDLAKLLGTPTNALGQSLANLQSMAALTEVEEDTRAQEEIAQLAASLSLSVNRMESPVSSSFASQTSPQQFSVVSPNRYGMAGVAGVPFGQLGLSPVNSLSDPNRQYQGQSLLPGIPLLTPAVTPLVAFTDPLLQTSQQHSPLQMQSQTLTSASVASPSIRFDDDFENIMADLSK